MIKAINAIKNHPLLAATFTVVILQVIFLSMGLGRSQPQFPLDDAWIHQTYARNLVDYGSWSFVPGEVSGGSTSPLWTLLLTPGFLFKGNIYFYWTLLLSIALLSFLIIFLCKSFQTITGKGNELFVILLSLLLGLEWHLQWAAASGMETIAFTVAIGLIIYLALQPAPNWVLIGITCGLLIWIRPDGLTLLGPITFVFLSKCINKHFCVKDLVSFLVPLFLFFAGYCVFNLVTTGQVFPNTFYAKQMEYREMLEVPIVERVLIQFSPIWVGVCVLLLPGFLYKLVASVIRKDLTFLGLGLWVIGYVLLYAIRLPVIYQHGRYIIPVIPLFILLGYVGTHELVARIKNTKRSKFVSFAVWGTMLAISIAFFIKGIQAYRADLKVIDTYMVRPAFWVEENTPPEAVIAVHDIGAMGFFGNRQLIDLAGLANPEVIPFIRDEAKIYDYLLIKGANYFVCFNDWYETSGDWGEVIATFNMNVDENSKEVDIIKLTH